MKRDGYASAYAIIGHALARVFREIDAAERVAFDGKIRDAIKNGVCGKGLRVKQAADIAGISARTLYDHVHLFGERQGGSWRIYEYDPRWKAFLEQKGKSRRGQRRGDNSNTDGDSND